MTPTLELVVLTLVILATRSCATKSIPDWPLAIMDALAERDKFLIPLRNSVKATKTEDIFKVFPVLETLSSKFQEFHDVTFTTAKGLKDSNVLKLFKNIQNSYTDILVSDLSRPTLYEKDYGEIGLGALLHKFKAHYDYACFKELLMPNKAVKQITLPLDIMCSALKKANHNELYASITNVCKDSKTCVKSEVKGQDACTNDKKCDIKKAIPHFGAMIWYKISDYLANVICGAYGNGVQAKAYAAIGQDLNHFRAYISMLGWDDFFSEATQHRGFASLDKLMDIVEKRSNITSYVLLACKDLNADYICDVSDILKQYIMLKQIKSGDLRKGPTRDLRRIGDYNIRNLVDRDNEELKHMKTMAAISSTAEVVEKLGSGLSEYFGTLASFDERISQADVGYIEGEIKKYDQKSVEVLQKLKDDVGKLMANVQTLVTIRLIDELVQLALVVAENSNPFKVMFTGVNVAEIYEQTKQVAAAASDVATAAALIEAIKELAKDSQLVASNFADNREQIGSIKKIVETIKSGKKSEINTHMDSFIKDYGAYTPKQQRSHLVANDAKWAAFVDRGCDILQGLEGGGIEQPIGQGVAGGSLLCERLQGTLAEFASLREDIYDFQFAMVDALTGVVRGNIAKKLASNIAPQTTAKSVNTFVRGFFMQHYKLQSRIFLYCNLLEYKKHGKKSINCPESGFFDYANIGPLLEENAGTLTTERRTVFIPTRPDYPGDMGYIDLEELKAGKEVGFTFPRNRTWLMTNNWIGCKDVLSPIVKSIKVYLPLRNYNSTQHTVTETTMATALGSFVHYKKDVRYLLPKNKGVFNAKYEENFGRGNCDSEQVQENPYAQCDPKVPSICVNTVHDQNPTVRPTVLSSWKLKYTVTSGAKVIKWEAPNPATNLYVKAKVILLMIKDGDITCSIKSKKKRRRRGKEVGCCPDGTYLIRWRNVCEKCPKNSKTALKGYYCEKDEKLLGSTF